MTIGGESSVDILVSLLGIGLSASLLETRGSWEGGSKKLYISVFKGEQGERDLHFHVALSGYSLSIVVFKGSCQTS